MHFWFNPIYPHIFPLKLSNFAHSWNFCSTNIHFLSAFSHWNSFICLGQSHCSHQVCIRLLAASLHQMTCCWYGHLQTSGAWKPWWIWSNPVVCWSAPEQLVFNKTISGLIGLLHSVALRQRNFHWCTSIHVQCMIRHQERQIPWL